MRYLGYSAPRLNRGVFSCPGSNLVRSTAGRYFHNPLWIAGDKMLDVCYRPQANLTRTAHMTGRKPLGLATAERINRVALFGGGGKRIGPLSTRWDISGNGKLKCLTPAKTELRFDQPLDDYIVGLPPGRVRQYIDMSMRCRLCANCLKLRGLEWIDRCKVELSRAPRSWFGTMTLSPALHDRMMWKANKRLLRGGTSWDRLTMDERFAERHKEISVELTKSIKRLREVARGPLRLVVVCEKHASGLPHYHALVHETTLGGVHERELRHAWPLGFSQWKLVEHDVRAAWYVSKYLMKSSLARVRASKDYGSLERSESDASQRATQANPLQGKVEPVFNCETKTPFDPPLMSHAHDEGRMTDQ